jgi:hypothetical protein
VDVRVRVVNWALVPCGSRYNKITLSRNDLSLSKTPKIAYP